MTQTLTFHRMQVVEVLQVEEDHTLLQKVLALQTLVRKRREEVENIHGMKITEPRERSKNKENLQRNSKRESRL